MTGDDLQALVRRRFLEIWAWRGGDKAITPKEISKATKRSIATVSQWKNGKGPIPLGKLAELATLLNVHPRMFLEESPLPVQELYPPVGSRPIGRETTSPQGTQGSHGGTVTSLPDDDRRFLERLADACMRAAATARPRSRERGSIEQLAVAFAMAADPTLGKKTVSAATTRQIAALEAKRREG